MAWRCSGDDNDALIDNLVNAKILKNARIISVLRMVDRGNFLQRQDLGAAYQDSPQPIGFGATISAPHMHSMMLELSEQFLQPGAKVLDVGSGSGFLAAVMAKLVEPNGTVWGIEHIKELAEFSVANIKRDRNTRDSLNKTLFIQVGDGRKGLSNEAPFDLIHVGAAPPSIPEPLVEQLKPGGRMVIPVGVGIQELLVVDKDAAGHVTTRRSSSVSFVPLCDQRDQRRRY